MGVQGYELPQVAHYHALGHGSLTSAANAMANGKDFFVELRKQVATLQRSGPPVGG